MAELIDKAQLAPRTEVELFADGKVLLTATKEDPFLPMFIELDAAGATLLFDFLLLHQDRLIRHRDAQEPPDLVVEMHERIDHDILTHPGEQDDTFEDESDGTWVNGNEEDEVDGDGSGLHQCQYCYNLVNEEHEEFCRLNPNRNRNIVP